MSGDTYYKNFKGPAKNNLELVQKFPIWSRAAVERHQSPTPSSMSSEPSRRDVRRVPEVVDFEISYAFRVGQEQSLSWEVPPPPGHVGTFAKCKNILKSSPPERKLFVRVDTGRRRSWLYWKLAGKMDHERDWINIFAGDEDVVEEVFIPGLLEGPHASIVISGTCYNFLFKEKREGSTFCATWQQFRSKSNQSGEGKASEALQSELGSM